MNGTLPTVSMMYDRRGRKSSLTDPDLGTWSYGYNSFGELATQLDAKNQQISNEL